MEMHIQSNFFEQPQQVLHVRMALCCMMEYTPSDRPQFQVLRTE